MTNLERALFERVQELEAALEAIKVENKDLKKEVDLLESKIVNLEEAEKNAVDVSFLEETWELHVDSDDGLEDLGIMSSEKYDEYMDTEIAEHSQSWIVQYNYDKKYKKYSYGLCNNPYLDYLDDIEDMDNEDEIPF